MLCLGKQIRRDVPRIRCLIRDDKNFGRPCDRINSCNAETCLFRERYIDVAGACDLVDSGNRLRAIGHRGNCLCTAGLVYLIRAGDHGCRERSGRCLPLRVRRRTDYDPFNACNLGRDYIHQHAGRVNRPSSRNIAAGDCDRRHFLAEDRPVRLCRNPAVYPLFFMVSRNIRGRPFHDFDKPGIQCCESFVNFLSRNADCSGRQIAVIKFLLIFEKRRVTARADRAYNLIHSFLLSGKAGRVSAF